MTVAVPPTRLAEAQPFHDGENNASATGAPASATGVRNQSQEPRSRVVALPAKRTMWGRSSASPPRSEEHTSELQSRFDLVCRLLLEKKNKAIAEWNHIARATDRQTAMKP